MTSHERLDQMVREARRRPLGWADGWVPDFWHGRTTDEISSIKTKLSELPTPLMTLDRSVLDSNISSMQEWCDAQGVRLAPHGKTTMSPELWLAQLRAGAWGITVANESQLRVARHAGVQRIILANLFIRTEGLRWLSSELDADEGFEFYCWVDSVESVRMMDSALTSLQARRRLNVLVELGSPQNRTGARSPAVALAVAKAARDTSTLTLIGIAGFEASSTGGATEEDLASVDRFLQTLRDVHAALTSFYEAEEHLITAGGSKYFDRVVQALRPGGEGGDDQKTQVVLRSGGYVAYDDGLYRGVSPQTRHEGPILSSAMHVWSRVISTPEPGLALLDAGKRDLPYDAGLPEPQLRREREHSRLGRLLPLSQGHTVIGLNDQHAYMHLPAESPLRVGDVVRLGLSHPCTAFDKWPLIPLVDDASAGEPVVVDLVRTYF